MVKSVKADVLRVSVAAILLRKGGVLSEELARALWLRVIGVGVVVLLLVDLEDVAIVLAHDLRYLLVDLLVVSLWGLAPLTCLKEVAGVLTLEPAVPRWPVESRIALVEGAETTMHHQIRAIWVFEVVSLLMRVQVGLLVESLVTSGVVASEGLFTRVDPQVSLKIEVKRELLAAYVTLVWFLTLQKCVKIDECSDLQYEQACDA